MAYQSLYRKYRPQTFDDVVGQEAVKRTLINAITEDRLHHAYLFAGPRGTGKTSTARILAKAINCAQGPTATPCGTCQLCVDITAGAAVDVVELDMASHGSVDDARELRERALFTPAQARRKVYILDEVHMASPQAFNALLKLIEEPPAHVLFTMATTDPQKVLTTILSRVQRLDLRRVGAADVAGHVQRIAESEGRQLDADAVDAVVRAGDGSVRDTMSILEQVLAYGSGTITGEQVAEVLGTTPADVTFRATQHLIDQDLAGVLSLVQELLDGGKDLRRFALDLVGHLRDLLVLQVAPDRPDLLDTTQERRAQLGQQAPALPRETLVRMLHLLAEALPEMRQGPPRLPLELALSRAAMPGVAGDVGALADRIARLESGEVVAPASGSPAPDPQPAAEPDPVPAPDPQPRPVPDPEPVPEPDPQPVPDPEPVPDPVPSPDPDPDPIPSPDPVPDPVPDPGRPAEPVAAGDAGGEAFARVRGRWDAVLERIREQSRRAEAIFAVATPVSLVNGQLTLGFSPQHANFHAKQAPTGDLARTMQEALEHVCGVTASIHATVLEDGEAPASAPASDAAAPSPTDRGDDVPEDEELAVAEAEAEAARNGEPVDDDEAMARTSELLQRELDAQPVDR